MEMAAATNSGVQDLEGMLSNIQENLQSISQVNFDTTRNIQSINESIEVARELLNAMREEAEMGRTSPAEASFNSSNAPEERLSDTARAAIESTEGPLDPENLRRFLMEKAFGKPKPDVLPIARGYSHDVEGIINQLNHIRKFTNEVHLRYKEEKRRLDVNLNKRIITLVANMRRELANETRDGRQQVSMDAFVVRENM